MCVAQVNLFSLKAVILLHQTFVNTWQNTPDGCFEADLTELETQKILRVIFNTGVLLLTGPYRRQYVGTYNSSFAAWK